MPHPSTQADHDDIGAAAKGLTADAPVDPTLELPMFCRHPLFRTYMCLPCANNYHGKMKDYEAENKPPTRRNNYAAAAVTVNDFLIEDVKKRKQTEYMCSLCSRHAYPKGASPSKVGHDAAANIVCTRRACGRSFCERCILWLSGGGELKIATTVPGWVCYVCRDSGICRPNMSANMEEFLKENNPDLLPPVEPNNPDLHGERTMPAGRMRDFVKATSFTQQNLILTQAQKSNRQAMLTKKNLSYHAESGIRVLSLFAGIEVALVAMKQLGIKIEKWCSCELEQNARQLVQSAHIDLFAANKLTFVEDINLITASYVNLHGPFHLVIGGSPCQDFSFQGNLNGGDRAGMEGDRGALVYEYFRVLRLVENNNARKKFPAPAFVYENVHGMSIDTKRKISSWLGVEPAKIDANLFSLANRPRDFYMNLPLDVLPGDSETNDYNIPTLQQILTPPAQALSSKAKCIITSNGVEVFATGRTNEFYQHDKKWIDCFNRVYRSRYDHSLGFRNLQTDEVERIFGLPQHYTSILASARSKDAYAIWSLCGNAFSTPVIVFILNALRPNFPPTKYSGYPYSYKLHERTALPPPVGSIAEVETALPDSDAKKDATPIAEAEATEKSEKTLTREEGEVDETLPKPLTSALWTPGLDSLDKTTIPARRGVRQLEGGSAVSNEEDDGVEDDDAAGLSLDDVKKVNVQLKIELAAVRKRCHEMEEKEDQQRMKQRKILAELQATVDVVVPPVDHMEERFQHQREQLREEHDDAIKSTMYSQMSESEAYRLRATQLRNFQLLKSYEDALYEQDKRRKEDQIRRQLERKDEAEREQQLKFKKAQRDAREFRTAAELAEVTPLKEVATQPRTTMLIPPPQPENSGVVLFPAPRGASRAAPARAPTAFQLKKMREQAAVSGIAQRPRGANPKGQGWDYAQGRWIPGVKPALPTQTAVTPAPAFLPGAPPPSATQTAVIPAPAFLSGAPPPSASPQTYSEEEMERLRWGGGGKKEAEREWAERQRLEKVGVTQVAAPAPAFLPGAPPPSTSSKLV